MGNVLDSEPTSYSTQKVDQIHDGYWTQTYKHRTNTVADQTDSAIWGKSYQGMQIGTKMILDNNTKDFYIRLLGVGSDRGAVQVHSEVR